MTVTDLIEPLRLLIGDLSRWIYKERLGYGDGARTQFAVKLPPIAEGSLSLFIDDVIQDSSSYQVDCDSGIVELIDPPSNGSEVSASYRGLAFYSGDLEGYIRQAVEQIVMIYPTKSFSVDSSGNIDPEPTSSEKSLLSLIHI